jgi:hypothetical protein
MSVDGTWNITLKTPMGAQAAVLSLTNGDGGLTGSLKSPMGAIDITEGTVDGDHAAWKANMTAPMPMTLEFTADIVGDAISGTVTMGPMGSAPFDGIRA